MIDVLETTMLVCFGCSWPLNVYKNAKAGTAKGMSLNFILLIITGYLAGIAAKLYTHSFNFVLVVYFINLLFVSINLVVYFVNRSRDRAGSVLNAASCDEESLPETETGYAGVNRLAAKHGVVLFGADSFAAVPFAELAAGRGANVPVHNRSIPGLSVADAKKMLRDCVTDLAPERVFVNLGENDLDMDSDAFTQDYQKVLDLIREACGVKASVVSVLSDGAENMNAHLEELAKKNKCEFIDISDAKKDESLSAGIFQEMSCHIRPRRITFAEAMGASD